MTIEEILTLAVQKGASDIHLKVGVPPVIRKHGVLRPLDGKQPPLTAEEINSMARQVMNETQLAHFERLNEIDFSFALPGVARFRFNVFRQRGTIRVVARSVPHAVPAYKDLSLPAAVEKLAHIERGLVLVTGVAGSGKSTTLASIINDINQSYNKHILTIEDPIEFLIRDRKSLITQREIGLDTRSFAEALRSGLRQDPDVILIGEMRDRETIEIALTAAETGHLVFSTLHTIDATETINRILSNFEAARHSQMRLQMGAVLKAVISQRLCRRADGQGFIPAVELMLNTARIREMIENSEKTSGLKTAIEEGQSAWGMQSFDQALMEHVDKGTITLEEALMHSTSPDDFRVRMDGITAMDGKKWARTGQAKKESDAWSAEVDLDLTSPKITKKA